MEYNQFLNSITECIQWKVDGEYEVKRNHIMKNNSIELDGIVFFKEGDNISPNIYLNHYYSRYQNGESVDAIANEIIHLYHKGMEAKEVSDYQFEFTFESMKPVIVFRLVNYKQNKQFLTGVPHIRFLDLAITFQCLVKHDGDGIGTVRITNDHLVEWNVTVKELMQLASKNTKRLFPPKIRTMREVMVDILKNDFNKVSGNDEEAVDHLSCNQDEEMEDLIAQLLGDKERVDSQVPMYVLSNESGINGASAMLYNNELKQFAMELDQDFYILPSSIHEVILVPFSKEIQREQLMDMVKDVNMTQVPKEDILSNKVYLYHRETNVIEI